MTSRRIAVLAIALSACASGQILVRADGSCEVRGIALGRAELVAYRVGSIETRSADDNAETSNSRELCAKVGGGTGSAAWWGAFGTLAGAIAGIWL